MRNGTREQQATDQAMHEAEFGGQTRFNGQPHAEGGAHTSEHTPVRIFLNSFGPVASFLRNEMDSPHENITNRAHPTFKSTSNQNNA
jgi:hypothetical protein